MSSPQPAFQPSPPETSQASNSSRAVSRLGRSPYFRGRPILLRTRDPKADARLTANETDSLLRSLTARDVAILTVLHQYRYLDRAQVQALFFAGRRQSQGRVRWLMDQHLIHRWLSLQPPGWHRRDSVLMLSGRGARVLAACQGIDARPMVRQSKHAEEHSFHITHDLETNGFFVGLAATSRELPGQGLYHWVGQEACRRLYRERGGRLTPDGWGRYLTPTGEIVFLLEWDRGSESPKRLGLKVTGYIRHFLRRRDAELNPILFVAPGPAREDVIRRVIAQHLPPGSRRICGFWTTDVDRLRVLGPLGPIWQAVEARGAARVALIQFPARPRSARRVEDCIGKPGSWERRPGGGEGA
jgi:Replication-relaxation